MTKKVILSYRILCVDDDEVTVETISNYFIKQGYETFTAISAKEALDVLSKHNINLVMAGVVMPGMDGLTMTNIITKKYPTKVIVITGYEEARKDAFRKGARAFVLKPCKMDALLEIVHKVMTEEVTYIGLGMRNE